MNRNSTIAPTAPLEIPTQPPVAAGTNDEAVRLHHLQHEVGDHLRGDVFSRVSTVGGWPRLYDDDDPLADRFNRGERLQNFEEK
jgi:hypothetical protein